MQKGEIKIDRQPDGRYIARQCNAAGELMKSEPLDTIEAAIGWLIEINGEGE